MYQTHFHLNDRPFASAPNPEHYFPAASIEQAREAIALSIDRASGVTLLMGPVGSGKTLLCQLLANQFARDLPVCLLPGERFGDRTLLLQAILHRLNLPYRDQNEGELRLTLSNHVTGKSCPNGVLLIVDEADRLPLELLEEIRVITNLVQDGQPCVRLVLAGGPRLEERVGHPKLESLNQRVVGRLHLDNFSKDETADYITARIAACGGDVSGLFTPEALEVVYQATAGVPRLVNQICDHALLMSSVEAVDQLDAAVIEEAWADLQQLPMPNSTLRGNQTKSDGTSDVVVEFGSLDEEDTNVAVCAQLDELQEVVTAANEEVESADIAVTGNVEVEAPQAVDDGDAWSPGQPTEAAQQTEAAQRAGVQHLSPEADELGFADQSQGDHASGWEADTDPNHEISAAHEVALSELADAAPGPDREQLADHPDILPSPFLDQEEQLLETPTAPGESDATENSIPVIELTIAEATNPFDEVFEDEEVVIQQFASPSVLAREGQPFVCSSYSQHLASKLSAAHPGLRMLEEGSPENAAHEPQPATLESGYRPLSAFAPPQPAAADPSMTAGSDDMEAAPTAAEQFDPDSDPVLPESQLAGVSVEVNFEQQPFLVEELLPSPVLAASHADLGVLLHNTPPLGPIAMSEPTILADEATGKASSPGPAKEKVFRKLFSSLRRACG